MGKNRIKIKTNLEPLAENTTKRHQHYFSVITIAILSFIIYGNTLKNNFTYDDISTVVTNTLIKDISNLPLLVAKNYPELSTELSYRPLVTLTYFMDYLSFGLNPTGYHLMNVLLHIGNGTLLYIFLNSVMKEQIKALLLTLLFVANPILSEAVNSISFREDLLAFFFYFGSLNIYIFARNRECCRKTYTRSLFIFLFAASCILYFFALLSKEMAATLPLIIYCYDRFYLSENKHSKQSLLFNSYYIGYLVVTAIYLYLRFYTFYRPTPDFITHWELYNRLITLPLLLLHYIKIVLFPFSLSIEYDIYPVDSIISLNFLGPLFILTALFLIALFINKRKEITFGYLFFLIALMPAYNIIPIDYPFAERYLYLPAAGVSIMVGALIYDAMALLCIKYKFKIRYFLLTPFILILSLNAVAVVNRNSVWRDDCSLWIDAVKKAPSLSRARFSLGSAYTMNGQLDKAIEQFRVALQLKPDYGDVYLNLGYIYSEQGKFDEAIKHYQRALQFTNYDLHYIYTGIGLVYLRLGLLDEAIKHFQISIKGNPRYYLSHYNLGIAYMKNGLKEMAKSEFETTLELNPDDADTRKLLKSIEAHGK